MSSTDTIFGPFRFNPTSRLLTEREIPVRLGSRAAAILGALIEAPGRLVSKAELLNRVWPGTTVDEANLKVQISSLRKILGDYKDVIRAEASLGYRFLGSVIADDRLSPPAEKRRFYVPRRIATPIGRADAINSISELFKQSRLITVLGPGGIGKTTVALEVANDLGNGYADGVCFVDLGRIVSKDQVYATITDALELSFGIGSTIEQLLLGLDEKRLLLMLDSCEHVREKLAPFIERILSETDGIDILVTSRESLGLDGEAVWRLEPLATPPASQRTTVGNFQSCSSIQLFLRAVRQGSIDFQVDDVKAAAVSEICRRLDGIPLAIELAASMVGVLGIDEVRRRLDESFSLLRIDRRTAIPRQRSMAATIDWSYDRLSREEQAVLRRLASFSGPFTLDGAIAIASDTEIDAETVRKAVAALTSKSLLNLYRKAPTPQFSLLETTRAYANQAPSFHAERDRANERHARYLRDRREKRICDTSDPVHKPLRECWEEADPLLNWRLADGFLTSRLSSFYRARQPSAIGAGLAFGLDRSGGMPPA
jgi:predicted ATPase/DNA-binding winged helix-turn-helix (wHTH) protein